MTETCLEMESKAEDGLVKLRFTHGSNFGSYLCTIVRAADLPLRAETAERLPKPTAWLYRTLYRLQAIDPIFILRSSEENHHYIRFDSCQGRESPDKVLVSASDGSDGGGIFLISREEFDRIHGKLKLAGMTYLDQRGWDTFGSV